MCRANIHAKGAEQGNQKRGDAACCASAVENNYATPAQSCVRGEVGKVGCPSRGKDEPLGRCARME